MQYAICNMQEIIIDKFFVGIDKENKISTGGVV